MKFLMSALAFLAGFVVARLALGHFGLSPVVQLLGGAGLGTLVAQPVWSYYADLAAFRKARGLFGDVPHDTEADDVVPHRVRGEGVEAARAIAARSRPADGFAARLRPVVCPSCGVPYERRPETTFFGFQRFTCGECRMVLRGPLFWGFRLWYWGGFAAVVGLVVAAAHGWHPDFQRGNALALIVAIATSIAVVIDLVTLLFPRRRTTFLR